MAASRNPRYAGQCALTVPAHDRRESHHVARAHGRQHVAMLLLRLGDTGLEHAFEVEAADPMPVIEHARGCLCSIGSPAFANSR